MKIYVASSWRNLLQQGVVHTLRAAGHKVYDFRHPTGPDSSGFAWSEIDARWKTWDPATFRHALNDPISVQGFDHDWDAMVEADAGVLVLPCGRSAHLEAGYFVGAGKPLHILLTEPQEPELMYRMATRIHLNLYELLIALGCPSHSIEPA